MLDKLSEGMYFRKSYFTKDMDETKVNNMNRTGLDIIRHWNELDQY